MPDGRFLALISAPVTKICRRMIRVLPLSLLLLASGCSTVGYYSQAISGHLKLMRARQPIAEVLADPQADPELKNKLQTLLDARVFAVEELGLPDNKSYSSFAETGRRAVTFNVVAAEEFSVNAQTWCFPIAGCVSYRGYFAEADAESYAEQLAEQGFDVTVGGASAYSTLGWFDDPVLDTMLRGGDVRFVGTLFHELAHQVLYIKDDSNFNEAYASFVEQAGLRIWLDARDEPARIEAYDASLSRSGDFASLLSKTRAKLAALYAQPDDELMPAKRREQKAAIFDGMRADYEQLKTSWGDYSGYDGWFARDLNNARLVAVSTYRRYVPAFAVLFEESGRDVRVFHEQAKKLADLPSNERNERMQSLLDKSSDLSVSLSGSAEAS